MSYGYDVIPILVSRSRRIQPNRSVKSLFGKLPSLVSVELEGNGLVSLLLGADIIYP